MAVALGVGVGLASAVDVAAEVATKAGASTPSWIIWSRLIKSSLSVLTSPVINE